MKPNWRMVCTQLPVCWPLSQLWLESSSFCGCCFISCLPAMLDVTKMKSNVALSRPIYRCAGPVFSFPSPFFSSSSLPDPLWAQSASTYCSRNPQRWCQGGSRPRHWMLACSNLSVFEAAAPPCTFQWEETPQVCCARARTHTHTAWKPLVNAEYVRQTVTKWIVLF